MFDKDGNPLIDLAVVIIDASTKDLRTVYDLINDVLVPCFGSEADKRIIIALNQADMAMKGKHWDDEKNEPDSVLSEFLINKVESVQKRVCTATGISVKPVAYCAGYKENDDDERKPYNLTKLLYFIINSIPKEKRLVFADTINPNIDNWIYGEDKAYAKKVEKSFGEAVWKVMEDTSADFAVKGAEILGYPGMVIGTVVGYVFGSVKGVAKELFSPSRKKNEKVDDIEDFEDDFPDDENEKIDEIYNEESDEDDSSDE